LGESSPFEEFMEADYFLFLAAELHPTEAPTMSWGDVWRPWSLAYTSGHKPSFLVRAERAEYAKELIVPLGLSSVDMLRDRYRQRGSLVQRYFDSIYYRFRLGTVDPNSIGRRA
jgi:hypothetical protein